MMTAPDGTATGEYALRYTTQLRIQCRKMTEKKTTCLPKGVRGVHGYFKINVAIAPGTDAGNEHHSENRGGDRLRRT
jgi:hypothetical protein